MYWIADNRSGNGPVDACGNGCCCEQATIAPGETAAWRVNYAPWMAQTGANKLIAKAEIIVQRMTGGDVMTGDMNFVCTAPQALSGSVAMASDGVGAVYTLGTQPVNGSVTLQASGAFTFTPANIPGPESFNVIVAGNGQTTIRRVQVTVQIEADFAFLSDPDKAFVSSLALPTDAPGTLYYIGGPSAFMAFTPSAAQVPFVQAAFLSMGSGAISTANANLGRVFVEVNGRYQYTPNDNVSGFDTFKITAYDPATQTAVERVITVELPAVFIPQERVTTNSPVLHFPVVAQRDAKIGDRYRITVYQPAQDCDGCEFKHVSCYDVTVARC